MKIELFAKLYQEAKEYSDVERYVAERGWQEWMDEFEDKNIGEMLINIYNLANSPLRANREKAGYSRAKFCRIFDLATRTVEDWEYGKSEVNSGTKMLIDYALYMQG